MLTLCVLTIASGEAIGSTSSAFAAKEEVRKLQWKGKKIEIALSRSLLSNSPNIKVGSDVAGAIRRSIAAWQNVAAVEIRTQETSRQDVSPSGLVGDGVSLITIAASPENILFFGKDPYSASAKTRIFYNRRGFITEADIVLNPFQLFSTDGSEHSILSRRFGMRSATCLAFVILRWSVPQCMTVQQKAEFLVRASMIRG